MLFYSEVFVRCRYKLNIILKYKNKYKLFFILINPRFLFLEHLCVTDSGSDNDLLRTERHHTYEETERRTWDPPSSVLPMPTPKLLVSCGFRPRKGSLPSSLSLPPRLLTPASTPSQAPSSVLSITWWMPGLRLSVSVKVLAFCFLPSP